MRGVKILRKIIVILLALLLTIIPQITAAQNKYSDIIESLDNITRPLDKSPLDLTDEDLECLAYLSDCKIVGLGEATHGTKEFFQLKHRIFKYLVENYDYKVFAFECDMGESYFVDRYLTEGEGDIDEIMLYKMHFWTWRTEEVKDLLLWMREYNIDKSDEDKIHFIGVDCQFLTYQSDIIMYYFNIANISLSEKSISFLVKIKQIGQDLRDYYSEMTLEEKEEIDQNVDNLIAEIEDFRDDLIFASSKYEFQFVKRLALNIKQVNNLYFNNTSRDYYMAQNTLWVSDLFGEETKIAIWAHNMHNMNAYSYYSNGNMGFHLKEALKEDYQIINFAFSFGSFTAVSLRFIFFNKNIIRMPPRFNSINFMFHHAEDENFILREIDIVVNSSFDEWVSETRLFLDIGALFLFHSYLHYHALRFKEHCDVIIYWDTTTASELLNYPTSYSNY